MISSYTREKKPTGTHRNSAIRLTLVSVIVVAGIALSLSWLMHDNETTIVTDESSKESIHKMVKDAPTRIYPPRKASLAAQVGDKTPFWEVDESQTNKLTRMQQRKWEIMHRPKREPQNVVWKKDRYAIFEHKSENMIASLITAKPGQGFIGTPNYNGITEDFLESCKHPILITGDDDEYSANLKRAMIDAKIEIYNRLNAGEDLVKILQDTRKELQDLASYKQIIESEFKKLAVSSASKQELQDTLAAANILLAKKGIAPIKGGPITLIKLKHFNEESNIK